jgi:hypothetical protein
VEIVTNEKDSRFKILLFDPKLNDDVNNDILITYKSDLIKTKSLIVLNNESKIQFLPCDVNEIEKLVENIKKYMIYNNSIEIFNPNSTIDKNEITFELSKRNNKNENWVELNGYINEGDTLRIYIINNHKKNLYFNILQYDETMTINSLISKDININEKMSNDIEETFDNISINNEFLTLKKFPGNENLEAKITLKLFVTSEKVDFSFVFQDGHRSIDLNNSNNSNELEKYLNMFFEGTRGIGNSENLINQNWITIEKSFKIEPSI